MMWRNKVLAGCAAGGVIGLSAWNMYHTYRIGRPALPPGSYYALNVRGIAYAECKSFPGGTIIVEYATGDKTASKNGDLIFFTEDGKYYLPTATDHLAECVGNPDTTEGQTCLAVKASVRHSIATDNCKKTVQFQ